LSFRAAPAPVVVDASVAVDLLAEADTSIATAWRGWRDQGRLLLAPPFIWLELANVLLRRKRLPGAAVLDTLDELERSGLGIADRGLDGVRRTVQVADAHALSTYDATYLWLAMDVDGALATRDRQLAEAARAEGVELALD
jgi:predicted nucleic acid-binding protein